MFVVIWIIDPDTIWIQVCIATLVRRILAEVCTVSWFLVCMEILYLCIFALPLGELQSIAIIVSVCLSIHSHISKTKMSKLQKTFSTRYLQPSLGPSPTTVQIRYVLPDSWMTWCFDSLAHNVVYGKVEGVSHREATQRGAELLCSAPVCVACRWLTSLGCESSYA